MTPAEFSTRILAPAAAAFPFKDSPQARALLLAIAGVESGWTSRFQEPQAFARGFWMFEPAGIVGVLGHRTSGPELTAFCLSLELEPHADAIFEAIAFCDPLAYACARLLLWTDPHPLPAIGDVAASMEYYVNLWRPGRFDAGRWTARFNEALASGPAVA